MPRPPADIFTPHGRVIIALVGIAGMLLVGRWLSQRRLGTGYGLLWLGVFFSLAVIAAFPVAVVWIGWVTGSREPEGGLRLGAFVVAFVALLYVSVKTSQLQRRIEELVQAAALRDVAVRAPAGETASRAPTEGDPPPPSGS